MQRYYILGLCCLLLSSSGFGQTIRGQITDTSGEPLIGASILMVGTTIGTVSDIDGQFSLTAPLPATLRFSYTGYAIQDRQIIDTTFLAIELMSSGSNVFSPCMAVTVLAERPLLPVNLRIGTAVTRIEEDALVPSDGSSLTTALDGLPGLQVQQGALNTQRLSIRGIGARTPFSTDGPRVYFADLPLTDGSGETQLEDFPSGLLQGVSIVRGPAPVNLGSNLGGAIYLEPQSYAERSGFGAFAEYGRGGYGREQLRAGVRHHRAADTGGSWFQQLSYAHLHADGYRQNNRYRRRSVNAQGVLHSTNDAYAVTSYLAQYQELQAQIPSSLNLNDYREDPTRAASNWASVQGNEDAANWLAGISHGRNLNPAATNSLRLRSSVFAGGRTNDEVRPFNVLHEGALFGGGRLGLELDVYTGFGLRRMQIGGEYFRENYQPTTFVTRADGTAGALLSDQREDRTNAFGYVAAQGGTARWQWDVGLNLRTTRFERRDETTTAAQNRTLPTLLLPHFATAYQWHTRHALTARLARGLRNPTVDETLASLDLAPETGWNLDLGIRGSFAGASLLTYQLVYFQSRVDNALVSQQSSDGQTIFANAGAVRYRGVETQLQHWLHRQRFTWTTQIDHTLSLHRFAAFRDNRGDFSGNRLTGVPRQRVQVRSAYRLGQFTLSLRSDYVGAMPADDANTVFSEAYFLLHSKLSYASARDRAAKKLQFRAWVGIDNLLDVDYAAMLQINASSFGGSLPRYYYPGLPRWGYVGVALDW